MQYTTTILMDSESQNWVGEIHRVFPVSSTHTIVRLAMRYGLKAILKDNEVLALEFFDLQEFNKKMRKPKSALKIISEKAKENKKPPETINDYLPDNESGNSVVQEINEIKTLDDYMTTPISSLDDALNILK